MMNTTTTTHDLGLHLNFTREDLDANRAGVFSDAQRATLRRSLLIESALYGFFALVALAGLLVINANTGSQTSAGASVMTLVLALLVVLFMISLLAGYRSAHADLSSGVSALTGRAHLTTLGRGRYSLSFGQQRFHVSAAVYSAFVEGRLYRVYYTPHQQTLLSAEVAES